MNCTCDENGMCLACERVAAHYEAMNEAQMDFYDEPDFW